MLQGVSYRGPFAFTLPNAHAFHAFQDANGAWPMTALRLGASLFPVLVGAWLSSTAFAQQQPRSATAARPPEPTLPGPTSHWGAYTATPGGNQICLHTRQ